MPERARGRARRARGLTIVVAAVGLLALGVGEPVGAATPLRVDGDVRLSVGEDATMLVDGATRYLDTLELRPTGTTLVNELSLEAYVTGVAEMPSRWPTAALEAQAVAARTYAWWSIERGSFDGYDICASVACQVFRGAEVVRDGGERWRRAVEATAGQVLVDRAGRPVLARYFSTSGGRTYANEDVFPSTGPLEHLVGIDDPYDEVSPYHRWTVEFTRAEFDAVLSRGDTLAAAVPVAEVHRIGDVTAHDASLRVVGADGTEVEVGAVAFRDFVSRLAPEVFPDRFPTARSDGLAPLPSTIPSSRFDVSIDGESVTFDGQGWGHGVGMGQYGARGRAQDGQDAATILAAYYGGLVPVRSGDLPDRIRVGLRDGERVAVRGDEPMRVAVGDDVLVDGAMGTWTFERDGGGWVLTPPQGTDRTLAVADTTLVEDVSFVDAVRVETEVNKPVELRMVVRDAAGAVVVDQALGVVDAGVHGSVWRFERDDGHPVAAGDYRVALVGTDADGATAGVPVTVSVRAQQADAAGAARAEPFGFASWLQLVVVGAVLALALSVLAIAVATRSDRS